jgi:hypothetical protein
MMTEAVQPKYNLNKSILQTGKIRTLAGAPLAKSASTSS